MTKTVINIPGHMLEIRQKDDGSPCNFFKDGEKADVLTVDELKEIKEDQYNSGYIAGIISVEEHKKRMEAEFKRGENVGLYGGHYLPYPSWSRGFDSGYNIGFRNCLHEIRESIDAVEEQWKKDIKH